MSRRGRLLDLDPDAGSWSLRQGSDTAVLVSHGFSATVQSVRDWAEAFAAAGFDVSAPLLPGHGLTPRECDRTGWADWMGALTTELAALRADHSRVVVAGISMGGGLCLRLAELHPHSVHGVILANPAVKLDPLRSAAVAVVGRISPYWPPIAGDQKNPVREVLAYDRTPLRALVTQQRGWRDARQDLARVTQPVLLLRSRVDHVVPALSSAAVLEGISSTDVTEIVFEESFHELTCDGEHLEVERVSVEFVRRISEDPSPTRPASEFS